MGVRVRGAVLTAVLGAGAVTLAGCETHSEAIANPCPNASSNGSPQEPKVGLTPDELKEQAGCSTSTEAADKVCTGIETLKTSVTDLKHVDVAKNGAQSLQDAINKVQDDVDALHADAAAALGPAIDQLNVALATLQTSIRNVISDGTGPVNTAAQNAGQSARDLESKAQSLYNCT